jgi:hypothetical protein
MPDWGEALDLKSAALEPTIRRRVIPPAGVFVLAGGHCA